MLALRRTSVWGFCCCFLVTLHTQALADEEGEWGPTTNPVKNPPRNKPGTYWSEWAPSLPSFPSYPSFKIPFFGKSSDNKDKDTVLKTDAKGLTAASDDSAEHSGSGSGTNLTTFEPSPTQERQPSLTETGKVFFDTERNQPTAFPHSSTASQGNNDSLVTTSHSTSLLSENVPFPNIPVSTNDPASPAVAQSPSPPTDLSQTPGHTAGVTSKQFPEEHRLHQAFPNSALPASVASTTIPKTTVPTALVSSSAQTTTINPALVETTLTRHPLGSISPPTSQGTTVVLTVAPGTRVGISTTRHAWMMESKPPERDMEANAGSVEKPPRGTATTSVPIRVEESATQPATRDTAHSPVGWSPPHQNEQEKTEEEEDENGKGADRIEKSPDEGTTAEVTKASTNPLTAGIPTTTDDLWFSDPTDGDVTYLPDCNQERSGICNVSDTWLAATITFTEAPTSPNTTNQSRPVFPIPDMPMLVPLHADWNSAIAAWGIAWEAHVYGLGCVFAMLTLASALNLLCLPLRCPSGCGYFALVSLFLLAACCTRAFSLLYDAYGHQERLASAEASLLLCEAPFPCLTAAFGLVFLLLSMRSRMQLSYSAFQRPCFLACLVVLHFAAAFGPVALVKMYQRKPPLCLLLSLISRGAFVALATFLSLAYFVFYCYVRADSKHIYHLNNTSPTPTERYNRCPFAESRDWDRAAATVCLAALFSLACAGLQLYAMLTALGLASREDVFLPWPWWAFQFSCRVCELAVCLTLAVVVAQPVYCSDHLPQAGSCWTELLAVKSPIMLGTYQWTLSQQEKLAIVDNIGHGETECLPLYTLVDERLGRSLNGLDLLYHSNRALAYRDLDLDLDLHGAGKPEEAGGGSGATSGGSSFASDSTADLRPPSPINLRRSIDEALFSEALFPTSLFSPARPFRCSDASLNNASSTLPNGCHAARDALASAEPGLYRTSSCVEMVAAQPLPGNSIPGAPPSPCPSSSSTSCSSSERWRGSSSSCSLYRPSLGGSSVVLCPNRSNQQNLAALDGGSGYPAANGREGLNSQRPYLTLGSASQESLDLDMSSEADRSVQEEFVTVCRQIDALSVCSETIDL